MVARFWVLVAVLVLMSYVYDEFVSSVSVSIFCGEALEAIEQASEAEECCGTNWVCQECVQ